jgi:hypothetical protein
MSDFDDSVFYPAFADAGFLLHAETVLPGCTAPTTFHVSYRRPSINPMTGVVSSDHEIEYQHHDAPTLAEGAEVILNHTRKLDGVTVTTRVLYRVRQSPTNDPGSGADGYWRSAFLTRITDYPY